MLQTSLKLGCVLLGFLCLILGVIGMFLPVMPSVPFVMLAAYFFSKGSRRLHGWLVRLPVVGNIIVDWEQYGVIKKEAKIGATITIVSLFSLTLIFVPVHWIIKICVTLIGVILLIYLWSRPDFS